jgi:hypothetical protein
MSQGICTLDLTTVSTSKSSKQNKKTSKEYNRIQIIQHPSIFSIQNIVQNYQTPKKLGHMLPIHSQEKIQFLLKMYLVTPGAKLGDRMFFWWH